MLLYNTNSVVILPYLPEYHHENVQNLIRLAVVGGRQWHLADSDLNTRVHDELFALLDRIVERRWPGGN